MNLYNKSCYGLTEIRDNSIDALITDPPYGINFQGNNWDKTLPNKSIWKDAHRVMKSGSYGLVFSFPRMMHRLMVDLEDNGFIIKDVLFWVYLNGMPKSKNIALDIDKELGVESEEIGTYSYCQGYSKNGIDTYKTSKKKLKSVSYLGMMYEGSGTGLKPSYEPIILIQKPIEKGFNLAQNIIKNGVGCLNFEETRIPYENGESNVGHNPHPKGRVPSNIIRTDCLHDGYDKFFVIPKVRQNAEDFNTHPTKKPIDLMQHLVSLITYENQTVLDMFMGSGTTGVACKNLNRNFIGYENDHEYFEISKKRIYNE